MIQATDIHVGYDGTLVLAGTSLTADAGRVVGLIGPNGSGKTTLLRALYQSLSPKSGVVAIDGVPLARMSTRSVARRIAVVASQDATDLPITVAEMVQLGRSPHRSSFQTYTAHDDEIAAAALVRVGARHLAKRQFITLSGGEKQRVLIARALAQQAEHLLLDEPTNYLDIRYQHEILQLVKDLGITTVVVLHDLNLASRYCDEVVLLCEGGVVSAGPPETVLTPEVLEPVYGVHIRTIDDEGSTQLIFRTRRTQTGLANGGR